MHTWTHQRKACWAILFGIGLCQIGTNSVQIGRRLRGSDSRLEVSQNLKDPPLSARIQEILPVHLLLVDHRHKEIRREKQKGPMEQRRRYTDDRKRMLVQKNGAAHRAAVVLKMAVPIRPGDDEIRGAVGAMLIGRVNEPAKIGLNVQGVEVVPTHFIEPHGRWILARVQPGLGDVVSCQTVEAAVAIAQIEIVGIGLHDVFVVAALDA